MNPVYALVKDLFFATKIVKTAQAAGFEARTFDHADRLWEACQGKEPFLVILDCEGLEREAFGLLEKFRTSGPLGRIPRVGYLSHTARDLKEEMRRAGCERVYSKSEFSKELERLLQKNGYGLPSRI